MQSIKKSGGSALGTVQSVEIALAIIDSLSGAERGKGVTELSKELKTTKARVFRSLNTLKRTGYAEQDEQTGKYRLGLKLYFIGQAIAGSFNLLAAGREEAAALRDRFGQSVLLSSIQDDLLVILHVALSNTDIEIGMRVGATFPVYVTAGGRIFLAFGDVDLDKYLASRTFKAYTKRTTFVPSQLRVEIAKVRRQGWASVPDEWQQGVNAVAAPIFGADGKLVASIAVLGLVRDVPAVPTPAMLEALISSANRVSRKIGWDGSPTR